MDIKAIGARIRSEREAACENQEEIAELAGISRRTLGRIELGVETGISIGQFMRVLDCLGLEIGVSRASPTPALIDPDPECATLEKESSPQGVAATQLLKLK